MSSVVNRQEAITYLNNAEKHIGGMSWQVQLLMNEVETMSSILIGEINSPVEKMYINLMDNLEKWIKSFQDETLIVNKAIETQINTGGEDFGGLVQMTEGLREGVDKKDVYCSAGASGLTDIGEAESAFGKFTGLVDDLVQKLQYIILSYKEIWQEGAAAQHDGVKSSANEAATVVRMQTDNIEEYITSFARMFVSKAGSFDDQTNTSTNEAKSKLESMNNKMNSISFDVAGENELI